MFFFLFFYQPEPINFVTESDHLFLYMKQILFIFNILISFLLCILLLWKVNVHINWEDDSYKHRIWLHRTNSLLKMEEFAAEYKGFECDVVMRDDSLFDITHDLPVTFGVKLEPYFQRLSKSDQHLWLDIKNLNQKNKSIILNRLNQLTNTYQIDLSRLIIESNDWSSLADFTQKGYYTSYYLPTGKIGLMTEEEKGLYIDSLNYIIHTASVKAFSFYGRYYDFMNAEFDNQIDFLIWEHHHLKEVLSLIPRAIRQLKDKQVKVILVKDKGLYHQ